LGDAGAERLELLRVLEELLDLLQLLDGLVDAGHVLERDLGRVDGHPLRPALAEAHHLRAAALHLVHQEDPEDEEEQEGQDGDQGAPPRGAAGLGAVDGDALLVRERELGVQERNRRDTDAVRRVVGLRVGDAVSGGVGLEALDLARLGLADEVAPVLARPAARRVDNLQGEEREHQYDENREKCALEKSVHDVSPTSPGDRVGRPCPRSPGVGLPVQRYHGGFQCPGIGKDGRLLEARGGFLGYSYRTPTWIRRRALAGAAQARGGTIKEGADGEPWVPPLFKLVRQFGFIERRDEREAAVPLAVIQAVAD